MAIIQITLEGDSLKLTHNGDSFNVKMQALDCRTPDMAFIQLQNEACKHFNLQQFLPSFSKDAEKTIESIASPIC